MGCLSAGMVSSSSVALQPSFILGLRMLPSSLAWVGFGTRRQPLSVPKANNQTLRRQLQQCCCRCWPLRHCWQMLRVAVLACLVGWLACCLRCSGRWVADKGCETPQHFVLPQLWRGQQQRPKNQKSGGKKKKPGEKKKKKKKKKK